MANSYIEYTSGLTATTYAIPFNFIDVDDVLVKGYDGSSWSDLSVDSRDAAQKTITLSAAPSSYQKIRVYRSTSTAQLVDFQNGSRLSERDLDTAYQQGLFVAQEVSEGASTLTAEGTSNVSLSGTTTLDDLDVTGDVEVTGNLKVDTIQDTTGTSAMTIDSDGNVGIGTSSPNSPLEVSNGTENQRIDFASGLVYLMARDASSYITQEYVANVHKFTGYGDNGSNEAMRIDSDGSMMLGTTTLVGHQSGNVNSAVALYQTGQFAATSNAANDYTAFINKRDNTSGGLVRFRYNGSDVGTITTNGSSTSYNTTSDYRLKENLVDITDGITRIKQLEPKKFNFIADAGTTVDGFIAHEVQAVVPESVTGTKDEVDDEGNPVMQGIDQAKLVPLLTAALQEAITKIEDLETRVAALES